MKLLLGAAFAVLVSAQPARACGVPDLGMMLADIGKAFETKTTPVHTPLLELGGGATTEGRMASVAVGFGWGEREDSWLFPGTNLTRVMSGLRSDGDATAVSMTYGWYTNALGMLALDLGAEALLTDATAAGPTARLLVGTRGVGVRLSASALFGDDSPRVAGTAELVVEVMDLGKRL